MVKKFWTKAFELKHFKLDYDKADTFVKSQWQHKDGISVPYLFYRMVVAVFFLAAFVISLLGHGKIMKKTAHGWKWPIYLTNWGFTLCTLQAVFALVIVTVAKMRERNQISVASGSDSGTLPLHYKIYWAMYTVATTAAVCITISYWSVIYNPDHQPLDALNILTHAMNGIMMTLDLFIVAHPIRIAHIYLPLFFALIYVIFNGIYYLAGGLDVLGRTYIYSILNWERTEAAFLACLFGFIFVSVVHTMLSLASTARRRLAKPQQTLNTDERTLPS